MLKNLFKKETIETTNNATACGAADKPSACGAADKPSACGAADKPSACGSACGAPDKK